MEDEKEYIIYCWSCKKEIGKTTNHFLNAASQYCARCIILGLKVLPKLAQKIARIFLHKNAIADFQEILIYFERQGSPVRFMSNRSALTFSLLGGLDSFPSPFSALRRMGFLFFKGE